MKEKNKTANLVLADMELFDFLKEKVGDRKTRTGAYCDLLEKSAASYVSPFLRKHGYEIQTGQCHVTITELAVDWHWHRATVRAFLDSLEEMGYISRTRLSKSVVITPTFAPNQSGDTPASNIGQDEALPADELEKALSGWVNGSLTDDETGEICERCHAARLIRLADESGENSSDRVPADAERSKEALNREIVERIAVAGLRRAVRDSRFNDPSAFLVFFRKELDGDWTSLLTTSKAISKMILESRIETVAEHSRERTVLASFRKPFEALWARAQERNGGLL
ncbi:MAG: MarR family transcriptional regulator [Bacteroidales bacterium]|nr:MarR family transcriptional regulator [Bacteroidales bacterium]